MDKDKPRDEQEKDKITVSDYINCSIPIPQSASVACPTEPVSSAPSKISFGRRMKGTERAGYGAVYTCTGVSRDGIKLRRVCRLYEQTPATRRRAVGITSRNQ